MEIPARAYPTFSLRQLAVAVFVVSSICAFFVSPWGLVPGWWMRNAIDCSWAFYPEYGWPGLVLSPLALVASGVDLRVWRRRSLWILSPLAVPLLLLCFGVLFRHGDHLHSAPEWPGVVVQWFPALFAPICISLLATLRSVAEWLLILSVAATAYWFTLGAQLMSAMSVTNVWL